MTDHPGSSLAIPKTVIVAPGYPQNVEFFVGQGDNAHRFIVSRERIVLSSPVWREMLVDPTITELFFPDDDPTAFSPILKLVHLQWMHMPRNPSFSFETIVQLALLVHRYRLQSVVVVDWRTWILEPMRKTLFRPGREEWLFVAWVFGEQEAFEMLAEHLVRETTLASRSTGFSIQRLESFPALKLADDIVGTIAKRRKDVLGRLFALCEAKLRPLLYPGYAVRQYDRNEICQYSSQPCEALMLGSLLRGLQSKSLWPAPDLSTFDKCVADIENTFSKIPIHVYPGEFREIFDSLTDHQHCLRGFWDETVVRNVHVGFQLAFGPVCEEQMKQLKQNGIVFYQPRAEIRL